MTRLRTMLWMGWRCMWRDKVALLLTFALPIAFFSIFVGIFGGMVTGGGGTARVKVIVTEKDYLFSAIEPLPREELTQNEKAIIKEAGLWRS